MEKHEDSQLQRVRRSSSAHACKATVSRAGRGVRIARLNRLAIRVSSERGVDRDGSSAERAGQREHDRRNTH